MTKHRTLVETQTLTLPAAPQTPPTAQQLQAEIETHPTDEASSKPLRLLNESRDLPDYQRMINLVLRDSHLYMEAETSFAAFEIDEGKAMVGMLQHEWHGHSRLSFESSVRQAGFDIAEYAIIAPNLMRLVLEGAARSLSADKHLEISLANDLFHKLVARAIKDRASDIHFERRDTKTLVRMRVHGDLFDVDEMPNSHGEDLIRLAMTVIADEGNKPTNFIQNTMQEAGITMTVGGITTKLRAQTLPAYTISERGQDLVLRVLPMSGHTSTLKTLGELGYLPEQVAVLDAGRSASHGLFCLAGVTGSGKSTTLQAMIKLEIADSRGHKKIITVEDPVEFVIHGATQIPVRRIQDASGRIDSDFADAMRAAMRADPDIIVGGEIRDEITAQLSMRMVLTGHTVFTTLHTSSAVKIPTRLADLGIDPSVMGSRDFFIALVYQKLMQVLCSHCRIPLMQWEHYQRSETQSMLTRIDRLKVAREQLFVRKPSGCRHCKHRGITDRTVVAEVIPWDSSIARYFRQGDEEAALEYWRGTNLDRTVLGAARTKMMQGLVSPFELESGFGKGQYLRDLEGLSL